MKRKTTQKPIQIVIDPARYASRCPICGVAISAQATVEQFGQPAKWDFWGRPGERWRRCEGDVAGFHYVHFRTLLNDQFSERMAWVRPVAAVGITQEQLL